MNGRRGATGSADVGRAILRERGFRHTATFVDQVGATDGRRIGAHELEVWTNAAGVAVLHDYAEDGWDLYLQAAPMSISIQATVEALDYWRSS